MRRVCMVVQDPMVKGGIAAVVNGYRGSQLEKDYQIIYIESYKDGCKLAKLFKGIQSYFHFMKVLLIDKPELIHIHSSFGPSFYRKLPFIYMASWVKLPIINHIHGADFNHFFVGAGDRKQRLVKIVYGKCSKLIALSNEWKERLVQIVPEEKVEVIENYSVLHEDLMEERTERSRNNQVLFLGELGRRKGCYDIPHVVELVVRAIPNVKFILCGSGNDQDETALRNLVKDKGIENNVILPGWVRNEKKDSYLRAADVFFLPSYNEGMPMSILDAMGYGLPIVSTNVGAISNIVRNGENGMCCNPGDVDGFAKAIIELLTNESMYKAYCLSSMDIIKQDYSLENHINKLESAYESM